MTTPARATSTTPTSTPDRTLVLDNVRAPGSDTLASIAIVGEVVTAVGPSLATTPGARRIDCGGRTAIPGLWDTHAHVTQWAMARRRIDLSATTSALEAARVLGDAVDRQAGDAIVVAGGMRTALWPQLPHVDMLDAVTGHVPVVASNVDLHTVWCNTAAMRLFGIDAPDGLLREADCYRVLAALDDLSTASQDEVVQDALADAAARGVVGIKDFEFGDAVPDWQRRSAHAPLPVRIDTTVYPSHLEHAITRGLATDAVVPGTHRLVRAGHLKLFTDGSLNSGTALCHEHLPDGTPGVSGHAAMTPAALRAAVEEAWTHGIAPAIHAIGDLAVQVALDTIEAVGCAARIEHAQLVATADLPRFRRPDLVVGVQPAHCTDDRDVTDIAWADRGHRAYPLASLVAAGARLEFGSDAPVSPLDPWAAIAAAVTRTADDRPSWHPEQCLDRATALAAGARGRTAITVGMVADIALVEADPLTCPPGVLRDPGVAMVLVGGRITHGPA